MTNPAEKTEYMSKEDWEKWDGKHFSQYDEYTAKEEWKKWDRGQIGHCQRGAHYMVPPMIDHFTPKLANGYIARELNSRVYQKCQRTWPKHDLFFYHPLPCATEIYEAFRKEERRLTRVKSFEWWKGISADLRPILKAEGVDISAEKFVSLLKKTKHVWRKIKL